MTAIADIMSDIKKTAKYTDSSMLLHFLKGSLGLFIVGIAASMLLTFFNTVIPKVIAFTIDSVLGDEPVTGIYVGIVRALGGIDRIKEDIWIVALVIIGIAAAMLIFRYCNIYFNNRANQTLMRRMRNELFSHIQRLPLSWQAQNNTGDIIQRCTSDADTISNFVTNQLFQFVRITFLLVLSLVFMFTINVELAAIAFAFMPVIVGYSIWYFLHAFKRFKKCDEEEGVLSTYAQENLTGVRVIRAFGKEKYERDKFDKQNVYYTSLWVRVLKLMSSFWTASDFIAALQLLCIVIVGTVFCVDGKLSTGDFVAFISYNAMMVGPVRELGRIISNLSKAKVALARIAEIMNADEEVYGVNEGRVSGDIAFDNVSFEYESGKPVLCGVSFTVPQGSTLGIIGGTGSGKSTLVALLDGLYAPTDGRITYGGRDVKDIPPATLRNSVGVVLQESYIYSRTIGENIALAAADGSKENIVRAAETACVADNIDGFANGYDTVVGERGVTLSGGQKQRVAIARTLIRKTPYIVFDDSLSAVDSDTDAKIRHNLKAECDGTTTIIVSHRITTVMHADNIIVLDGGRVAESGNHESLLAANGIYKRIYDLQMSLPEDIIEEVKNGR